MYRGFQNYDTTYRNISPTFNNIYTLSTDFKIAVGKLSQIQTGSKYSCNNMLYEALVGDNMECPRPKELFQPLFRKYQYDIILLHDRIMEKYRLRYRNTR